MGNIKSQSTALFGSSANIVNNITEPIKTAYDKLRDALDEWERVLEEGRTNRKMYEIKLANRNKRYKEEIREDYVKALGA